MEAATAVAQTEHSAQPKKNQAVLMPERIGHAEDKRHDWVVDLPMSVTLEEAMEPSYWAHVAEQMDPGDHIEVRAEDMSWIAFLIVSYCERNYAKVVLDRAVKIGADTDAPVGSIKHRVEWKGPLNKYSVINVATSKVLQSGLRTKEAAMTWLQDHERTIGR